jgi:hypothetical protein
MAMRLSPIAIAYTNAMLEISKKKEQEKKKKNRDVFY